MRCHLFLLASLTIGLPCHSSAPEVDFVRTYCGVLAELRTLELKNLSDLDEAKKPGASRSDRFIADLRIAKRSISQLSIISKALAPFSKSKREEIALSASGAEAALKSLIQLHTQSIPAIQTCLNSELNPSKKVDWASLLTRATDRTVKMEQSWGIIWNSTQLAVYSLIDQTRVENDTLPFLVVTREERAELIRKLDSSFGPTIAEEQQGDRSMTLQSAWAIRFILTSARKSRDEPPSVRPEDTSAN